jgi:hypothetical protein
VGSNLIITRLRRRGMLGYIVQITEKLRGQEPLSFGGKLHELNAIGLVLLSSAAIFTDVMMRQGDVKRREPVTLVNLP